MVVRTRFAPSPTGHLHIGGVRTALFSWLYARHNDGEFILRIEDTDQQRSTEASVQTIIDGLQWLGLTYDEGPYFQTQRYERYLEVIDKLLQTNNAYRCYCSKERLEKLRETQLANSEKPGYDGRCRDKQHGYVDTPHVIRFKTPKTGVISFLDQVYGDIHVNNAELDDFIILRSDKHPTYNFVVVVDDLDMGITHVIRGDDHINNTPRQIHLLNALSAPVPVYAHLSMILGEDGKRLSKRHGAVNILEFKKMGFLPHALLNYLVRLGWSSGDQEIFSMQEMIEQFDLTNITRGAASFNYEKLYWLNQHYQKHDDPEQVAKALHWHFDELGMDVYQGPDLKDIVIAQAERCKTLAEMAEKSRYFFENEVVFDETALKKHLRPVIFQPLTSLCDRLSTLDIWQADAIQSCINDITAEFNLNMGKVAQPLRVAVTGNSMSPPIDITLMLLGKDKVLARLKQALSIIQKRMQKT